MTLRARLAAGVALILLAGTAARAQDGLLPSDCTAYLTVQRRDCVVEHHYTCAATPGHRWRVDYDDEDGARFISETDAEGRWIWSQDVPPEGVEARLLPDATDHASIGTLLATGEDSYAFRQRRSTRIESVEGFDRLTGVQVEIDGEALLVTEYGYRVHSADGMLLADVSGSEFVSARHRRFFSGTRTWHSDDGDQTVDSTPVEFVYPGESGFLSEQPRFGCYVLTSGIPATEGRG